MSKTLRSIVPLVEKVGKRGHEKWDDWQDSEYRAMKPDASKSSKKWTGGGKQKPEYSKVVTNLGKGDDFVGSGGPKQHVAGGKINFRSAWYKNPVFSGTGKVRKQKAPMMQSVRGMDRKYMAWKDEKDKTGVKVDIAHVEHDPEKVVREGDVLPFKKNRFNTAFKGAQSGPVTGGRKVVADRRHFDVGNETRPDRNKKKSDNPYEG